MAMECAHGRMHVIPEIGIVEILRPDGARAPRARPVRSSRRACSTTGCR